MEILCKEIGGFMKSLKLKETFAALMLGAVTFAALASVPAQARPREWRHEDWGRGRWIHDRHGGRLGWWWVVGGMWYWYERPHTFVVQSAPPVVVQQTPPVVIQQVPPPAPAYPPPPVPAPAPAPVSPVL